uniref:Uncharacterized protein n=1 Tax=Romanomermis culicivorax TaxID=13658 RepID=A0A915K158_ROMCU
MDVDGCEIPGTTGQTISEDPDSPPDLIEYLKEFHDVITNYWRLIQTNKSTINLLDHTYSYRWCALDGNVQTMIEDIYKLEEECFRIDGAIGCILKNRET